MKQKKPIVRLRNFTSSDHPFGNVQGREVLAKLLAYIEDNPSEIYEVSLEGIEATDASFPRESVISLAKMHKGEKGFFITGKFSKDLFDNWNYAAVAKDQPLILKDRDGYRVLGPELNEGARDLLGFVMEEGEITTAKVVQKFGGTAQNASAKLKRLFSTGLILGHKEVAESGGLEYVYKAIR